jgi:hypothetical protein
VQIEVFDPRQVSQIGSWRLKQISNLLQVVPQTLRQVSYLPETVRKTVGSSTNHFLMAPTLGASERAGPWAEEERG